MFLAVHANSRQSWSIEIRYFTRFRNFSSVIPRNQAVGTKMYDTLEQVREKMRRSKMLHIIELHPYFARKVVHIIGTHHRNVK